MMQIVEICVAANPLEGLIEYYNSSREYLFPKVAGEGDDGAWYSKIKYEFDKGLDVHIIIADIKEPSVQFLLISEIVRILEPSERIIFKGDIASAKSTILSVYNVLVKKRFGYEMPAIGTSHSMQDILLNETAVRRLHEETKQRFLSEGKILPKFLVDQSIPPKNRSLKELFGEFDIASGDIEQDRYRLEDQNMAVLLDEILNKEKRTLLHLSEILPLTAAFLLHDEQFLPHDEKLRGIFGLAPTNVIFLLFDNLGYFDFVSTMQSTKTLIEIQETANVYLIPTLSSILSTTDQALGQLARIQQDRESFVEKIISICSRAKKTPSTMIASRWSTARRENKLIFDTIRDGIHNVKDTIYTLNQLAQELPKIHQDHFFIIFSGEGLVHETGKEHMQDMIRTNVIKRIFEAIRLFPKSTIIMLGDHGVTWDASEQIEQQIMDGNPRIAVQHIVGITYPPIPNDVVKRELFDVDATSSLYPLLQHYHGARVKKPFYHGGISFSESIVPLMVVVPREELKKDDLPIVDKMMESGVTSVNLSQKHDDFITLDDRIISILVQEGPCPSTHLFKLLQNVSANLLYNKLERLVISNRIKKLARIDDSDDWPRFAIWFLPQDEKKVERIISFFNQEVLSTVQEIKSGNPRRIFERVRSRGKSQEFKSFLSNMFILKILQRLYNQGMLKCEAVPIRFCRGGKAIFSETKIYYIDENEILKAKRYRYNKENEKALDSIISNLSIPCPTIVKEFALSIALKADSMKGKERDTFISACLSRAYTQFGIPAKMDVFADAVCDLRGIPKESPRARGFQKSIFDARRLISKEPDTVKLAPPNPSQYIDWMTFSLDIPNGLYLLVKHVMGLPETRKLMEGKDPFGSTGTILYLLSNVYKHHSPVYFEKYLRHLTQRNIALAAKVCEVTIRNRQRSFEKSLNFNSILEQFMKIASPSKTKFPLSNAVPAITEEKEVDSAAFSQIVRDLLENGESSEIIQKGGLCDTNPYRGPSVLFKFRKKIMPLFQDGEVRLIITKNPDILEMNSTDIKFYILDNTLEKKLYFSFDPLYIFKNVPKEFIIGLLDQAKLNKIDFLIQFFDSNSVHVLIVDVDSIEPVSANLIDMGGFTIQEHEMSWSISSDSDDVHISDLLTGMEDQEIDTEEHV